MSAEPGDTVPFCPECDTPMILRRNRQPGPRNGTLFWGCSGEWSREENQWIVFCPGTLPIPLPTQESFASFRGQPRQGGTVRFLQATSYPASVVSSIERNQGCGDFVRAVSQWRLDGPGKLRNASLTPELEIVLGVASTLLERGTASTSSVRLESLLERLFPGWRADADAEHAIPDAFERAARLPANRLVPILDFVDQGADRELDLWEQLETYIEDNGLAWHVMPQVHLSSLDRHRLFPIASNERCDFFVSNPLHSDLDFVIEVDGGQGQRNHSRDQRRVDLLRRSGITTIRVTNQEVAACGDLLPEAVRRHLEQLSNLEMQSDVTNGSCDLIDDVIECARIVHMITTTLIAAMRDCRICGDVDTRILVVLPSGLDTREFASDLVICAVDDAKDVVTKLCSLYGFPDPQLLVSCEFVRRDELPSVLEDLWHPENQTVNSWPTRLVIGPADCVKGIYDVTTLPVYLYSDMCMGRHLKWNDDYLLGQRTVFQPNISTEFQRQNAEWFLEWIFRKKAFREGQWSTVRRTIQGADSVVLLPTGSGKSIAFQLAGLLRPGRTIVVEPIIALMHDQVENLLRVGIDRSGSISSLQEQPEKLACLSSFKDGHYLFCYVSPERFQSAKFREHVGAIADRCGVGLIAVDEAHCVSEWGHDFRPSYLNLGRVARDVCRGAAGPNPRRAPPVLGLTGTASNSVLKDVQRDLGILDPSSVIRPASFDRPNLYYRIYKCSSERKRADLRTFLETVRPGMALEALFERRGTETIAGLVFCPHINGKFGTEEVATYLRSVVRSEIPTSDTASAVEDGVNTYSGKAPRSRDETTWTQERIATSRRFRSDQASVLVCTKAFGMGIDKPNILYTAHTSLPHSLEQFYQEAGRAGRDGKSDAFCAVIVSNDVPARTDRLLDPGITHHAARQIMDAPRPQDPGPEDWPEDDITRALFFHFNTFVGEAEDLEQMKRVLVNLGQLETEGHRVLSWEDDMLRVIPTRPVPGIRRGSTNESADDPDQEKDSLRRSIEKAVCRLINLGVVRDYTMNWAAKQVVVDMAGSSLDDLHERFVHYISLYDPAMGERERNRIASLEPSTSYRDAVLTMATALVKFIYEVIEASRRRSLREMLEATQSGDGEVLRRRVVSYFQSTVFGDRINDVIKAMDGGISAIFPILRDVTSESIAEILRGEVIRTLESYPYNPALLLLRAVSEQLSGDTNTVIVTESVGAYFTIGRGDRYRLGDDTLAKGLAFAEAAVGFVRGQASPWIGSVLRDHRRQRDFLLHLRSAAVETSRLSDVPRLTTLANEVGELLLDLLADRALAISRVRHTPDAS